MIIICQLCNKQFNGQRGLASHLRQFHNYDKINKFKEYYDKYLLNKNEDLLCPICKKYQRKFYSFSDGYCKTCIGQIDENGNKLNCRSIWANRDKEKSKLAGLKGIEKMKTFPSKEDPTRTIFNVKKEKWYNKMIQKDKNGKTKFNKIGEKIKKHHNLLNIETGLKNSEIQSQKAANTRLTTILSDGKTLSYHTSKKAAQTVKTTIMDNGKTQKECMIEKALDTKKYNFRKRIKY